MSFATRHRCVALVFFMTAWSVWAAVAMTNGWVRRSDVGAPLGRLGHTTVWTGHE